jgi:hypothetical protein
VLQVTITTDRPSNGSEYATFPDPIAGGSPTLLAVGPAPARVAVDDTHIYWTDLGELRKKKYAETDQPRESKLEPGPSDRRRSSRHVPAAVRRRVAERDARRCTYVDARGQRCRETGFLEFHHLEAHAHGGPTTEANITLRGTAHNTLAAEPAPKVENQSVVPRPAPAR